MGWAPRDASPSRWLPCCGRATCWASTATSEPARPPSCATWPERWESPPPSPAPTFTLANTYEAPAWPDGVEPLVIHHIDAYRLEGDADAEDLALAELLDSGGIVVVEWAERLTLPPDRLDLHFAYPPELDAVAVAPAVSEPPDAAAPAVSEPPDAAAPAVSEPPDAAACRIVSITPHGPSWQSRHLVTPDG